jgi:hypothetical protein
MGLQTTGPQGQIMALGDQQLSESLLTVLERRYLPGISELGLVQVQPDANLMANIRFLKILGVSHSPDIAACIS